MNRNFPFALMMMALAASPIAAEEKADKPHKTPTPLRLQVVFTRYQGEKKVSSVPYTLSVSADDRPARVRMGIQVPLRVKDAKAEIVYRDVGSNLDCSAETQADGRFKLNCSFEQSSLYSTDGEQRAKGSAVGDVSLENVPLVRSFRSDATMLLRDGQSAQYVSATDPVSGEVLKVDVMLSVVK